MDTAALERELAHGLLAALEHVGLTPGALQHLESDRGANFSLDDATTGNTFIVECKSIATPASVRNLDAYETDGYKVLASRRISQDLRGELSRRGIGFYDGRGHLRLHRPPLVVDTVVPGLSHAAEQRRRLRIDRGALLDVTLAVLMGQISEGVRATASKIERSPGTVSKNLSLLRDAGLVHDDNTAVVPELFAAVAEEWRPNRLPLAQLPTTKPGAVADKLMLGLRDQDDVGWVLADHHAAAAWGAPVVIDSSSPPDFYVPSAHAASNAKVLLGAAEFGRHACTIAVAPSAVVCRNRFTPPSPQTTQWPSPAAVVAALDLASDPGRGSEILHDWQPANNKEISVVW